jgi:hypothetical protein
MAMDVRRIPSSQPSTPPSSPSYEQQRLQLADQFYLEHAGDYLRTYGPLEALAYAIANQAPQSAIQYLARFLLSLDPLTNQDRAKHVLLRSIECRDEGTVLALLRADNSLFSTLKYSIRKDYLRNFNTITNANESSTARWIEQSIVDKVDEYTSRRERAALMHQLTTVPSAVDFSTLDRNLLDWIKQPVYEKDETITELKQCLIHNNSNQYECYAMALETAAFYGQNDLITQLLFIGADVGYKHSSPLTASVVAGNVESARILLAHGALFDRQRNEELMLAVEDEQPELVKLLLRFGAAAKPENCLPQLREAVRRSSLRGVDVFLRFSMHFDLIFTYAILFARQFGNIRLAEWISAYRGI